MTPDLSSAVARLEAAMTALQMAIWGDGIRTETSHKNVLNKLAAAQAVVEAYKSEWRPISEAPKDGTWVLVCADDYDCWMPAQWGILNINPNDPKWNADHGWCGYGYKYPEVTRWIPMPPLPAGLSAAKEEPCKTCGGPGKVSIGPNGELWHTDQDCHACNGTGKVNPVD